MESAASRSAEHLRAATAVSAESTSHVIPRRPALAGVLAAPDVIITLGLLALALLFRILNVAGRQSTSAGTRSSTSGRSSTC